MAAEGIQNAVALGNDRIRAQAEYIGDTNSPLWQWAMTKKDKERGSFFGTRMPFFSTRDGGETMFTYADPSARAYIPEESDFMRIYPSNFMKSMQLKGDLMRQLEASDQKAFDTFEKKWMRFITNAKIYLSALFHGDGSGTLGVSNSVASGAAATINCLFSSGGTSAVGVTKGASQFRKNEIYDSINPATGAVRGTFKVTTEGRRTMIVDFSAGSTAVNDKLVVTGSYNLAPNGLRNLASFENRILQGFDTANNPTLNTPTYDLNGNVISPAAFKVAKGLVETFTNDSISARMIIMTPGHNVQLTNQAFQYRTYVDPKGNETVFGVFSKYIDADGDVHFVDSYAPDEQIRVLNSEAYGVAEEKSWGYLNGNSTFTMLHGTFLAGSDQFFLPISWNGQLYKTPRGIDDCLIDDVAHTGVDYPSQAYV
jgi:hypothetical protein